MQPGTLKEVKFTFSISVGLRIILATMVIAATSIYLPSDAFIRESTGSLTIDSLIYHRF